MTTPRSLARCAWFAFGAAALLVMVSCGGGDEPPPPPNNPPAAAIATVPLSRVGSSVSLDGTASTDSDGDALSYAWVLADKPAGSAAVLTSAMSARPALVPDRAGIYVVSLTVSDGKATSSATDVDVVAAQAGTPSVMVAIGNTTVSAIQHARIQASFEVRVTDAFGDPVNLVPVTFSSSLNNPSRPPIVIPTFTDGTVLPSRGGMPVWINYFHIAGQQQIVASAPGLAAVIFNLEVMANPHDYDGLYACAGEPAPTGFEVANGVVVSFPGAVASAAALNEATGTLVGNWGSGIFQRRFAGQISIDDKANARLTGTSVQTTGGEATGPTSGWSCARY